MADSITLKSVQNNGSVTLVANNQTILLQGKAQGPQGIQGIQGDPATNLVTSVAGRQGVVVLDKTDVGLGNVDNTNDLSKPISTATQTALDTRATTAALQAHANNTSNPHEVTKGQVGLGNVDNTSDANKPVSTATQTALDGKLNLTGGTTSGPVNYQASGTSNDFYGQGVIHTPTGKSAYIGVYQSGTYQVSGLWGVATPGNANYILGTTGTDTYFNTGSSGSNLIFQTGPGATRLTILGATGDIGPGVNNTQSLGVSSHYWSNVYTTQATIGGTTYTTGTGFPEGVVSASVGSIYIDTAVTSGASSWIKKSGSGNTGWQVLEGDTGWRQMKADWNVSPRSSGDGFVERLLIRRVGNRITLACYLDGAFGGGKNHSVAAFLPVGFRNTSSLGVWPEVNRFRLTSSQTTYVDPILETGTAGNLRIITPSPTHEAYSEIAWVTDHPWPATLPGVSA